MVAEVLGIVENHAEGQKLKGIQKLKVLELGSYLTNKVMNSKVFNWSILSSLQKIAGDKSLSDSEKMTLKTKLYQLIGSSLPNKKDASNTSYANEKKLEKAFWKNLQ